ncbi:hypothetical protein HS088_TW04G01486 [Tripterygium wilfordii]|uniref:Probable purine permease n=1 Tax=Tripterygium wilfordii TaxID=458696 RepID=A0A7J7DT78_TRIWF|nr:probable purine permease 5 [Tripterygium wilfordii]KAF5749517.1 hypothetical protein HS088_TW04G01486 [Tripterygium wilfordii]
MEPLLEPGERIEEEMSSPRPSDPFLYRTLHFKSTTAFEEYRRMPISHQILLVLSTLATLVAFPASSLLSRVYYSNGGTSKWVISLVAVCGWPLTALILLPMYVFRGITPTPLNSKLTLSYIALGFLTAADGLMFAYAYAYLPASTAVLVATSSLVFSALFGHLIVKNKLNAATINSIVIITAGVTIIVLDSDSDRYGNVIQTQSQYVMGFILDVVGSALHGLILALSELVFVKLLGRRSVHVVLENHIMVSSIAFVFTSIGFIISKDFQWVASEAKSFKGGEAAYVLVLIWAALSLQLGVLGCTAVLYLTSTVLAGILNAVRVPVTSIAAVVLLHDPMSGLKILSLMLTFWGFGSYLYGNSSKV